MVGSQVHHVTLPSLSRMRKVLSASGFGHGGACGQGRPRSSLMVEQSPSPGPLTDPGTSFLSSRQRQLLCRNGSESDLLNA